MGESNLVIRAGRRARERLRSEGFHADLFHTLVGASGGPKWLVLRHLDTVLIDRVIRPRSSPLDLLGSSIGSFRHVCFAQSEPHVALACFEPAYVEQSYAAGDLDRRGLPSMAAISRESERILSLLLGERGAREVCEHDRLHTHIVAARLRRDRGLDRGLRFQLQMGAGALANAFSRAALGRHFERVVFRQADTPLAWQNLPTTEVCLTPDRVESALLASGSIPLLMEGVRDVPGLPGTYFDGGIVDYHFDFDFHRREGLVLFPHFFDRITPGWFDKPWRSRRPAPKDLEDVVMIAPSDGFIARLPDAKVPDRDDFTSLAETDRVRRWYDVVDRCRALADELEEKIETGRLADAAEPFDA